jgi:hypothetical protein
MSIDLSSEDTLYASVTAAVTAKWNSVGEQENPYTGERWLCGVFGDVDLELRAFFSGTRPTVRATCGIARYVPKTPELIIFLNQRNRDAICFTLGIVDERDAPETVQVVGSSSVLYDFITATSVRQTVENCVWPANIILRQGFLSRLGGQLALAVHYRMLAEAARTALEDAMAATFGQHALDLESRARANDVGQLPDEVRALIQ